MSSPLSLLDWTPAPRVFAAPLAGVHLFLVDLDIFQPSSLEALSAAERQRGARFHFAEDRKHFLASRVALREILSRLLETEPRLLLFQTGPHGKPELAGDHTGALHFNLSHSAGHLLLAVSSSAPLGVDLEEVRSEVEMEPLAEHYFSPEELWKFRTARGQDRIWTFFETWTAIEARLKAEGCGLTAEPLPPLAQSGDVSTLRIAGRFAACVATREPQPFMHTWTWPS